MARIQVFSNLTQNALTINKLNIRDTGGGGMFSHHQQPSNTCISENGSEHSQGENT